MWVPEADRGESPEQQEQVPADRVLRIIETVYGQRQDKEHNPHGEHAHDVWQVGPADKQQYGGRGGEGLCEGFDLHASVSTSQVRQQVSAIRSQHTLLSCTAFAPAACLDLATT